MSRHLPDGPGRAGRTKPAIHLRTGKGKNVHTTYDLLENTRRGVAEMAVR